MSPSPQSTKKKQATVDAAELRRGIGSVDVAMMVLGAVRAGLAPQSLKAISDACAMPASNVHRYLASLIRADYIRQDPETRNYGLGGAALQLGLAALSQLDIVKLASQAVIPLVEESGLTAILSVWSDRGPTIVQLHRGRNHVVTTLGLGSVLRTTTSATGRVFLAFSSSAMTAPFVTKELNEGSRDSAKRAKEALEIALARVRTNRISSIDGTYVPGLKAFSAPVLDAQGEAALAITLMAASITIKGSTAAIEAGLATTCRLLSRQAGFTDHSERANWPSSPAGHRR